MIINVMPWNLSSCVFTLSYQKGGLGMNLYGKSAITFLAPTYIRCRLSQTILFCLVKPEEDGHGSQNCIIVVSFIVGSNVLQVVWMC